MFMGQLASSKYQIERCHGYGTRELNGMTKRLSYSFCDKVDPCTCILIKHDVVCEQLLTNKLCKKIFDGLQIAIYR